MKNIYTVTVSNIDFNCPNTHSVYITANNIDKLDSTTILVDGVQMSFDDEIYLILKNGVIYGE